MAFDIPFDPAYLATLFTSKQSNIAFALNTLTPLVPADPRRVSLLVTSSVGATWIRPSGSANTNVGFGLGVSAAYGPISFRDYPGLVGQAWTVFSNNAGVIYVLEIIYIGNQGD